MKLKIFRKKRVILATIYTGRNFFYIFFVMFVCLFAIGGCTLTDSGTSGLSNKSPGGDGNSIPRADLAVHGGGAYVAISKDLNSQAIYFETGRTAKEAFGAAITECEAFADNRAGCVVIRTYNTVLEPRIDGDPAKPSAMRRRKPSLYAKRKAASTAVYSDVSTPIRTRSSHSRPWPKKHEITCRSKTVTADDTVAGEFARGDKAVTGSASGAAKGFLNTSRKETLTVGKRCRARR
jgi:hypothetical protein